ncbi:choline O-acetyltransferase-like [Tachypleus tridentatus]|uniref:choline O-acetyltransferase-like n=1 Tax=Tachypleus tridentatus TaxID=6853 RepID=UPI003FD0CAB6
MIVPYYRVHRKLVSTYESASLRAFHLGRVDNIRAATIEALKWSQAMCDENQDVSKIQLFQDAIKKQTEILRYTVKGEGPDIHLVGLREMSTSGGHSMHALFLDRSYQEFMNFRLSTSQVPSDKGILVGYGPVVSDGYGCCYNPQNYYIDFCVSSFFSAQETSSDFFALSLEGSLLQMRELCLKAAEQQARKTEVLISASV